MFNGKTFFWGAGNVGKCGEIWGNTSTDLPIFSANIEGLTEGQSKSAAGYHTLIGQIEAPKQLLARLARICPILV